MNITSDMLEKRYCFLCGSNKNQIIHRHKNDAIIKKNKINYEPVFVMCDKCGLVYQNPRLKKDYIEDLFSKNYRPSVPTRYYLEQKRADALDRIRWLKEIVPDFEGKKILDIGCAEGSMLYLLKKEGAYVYGVEPNEQFSKYGSRIFGLSNLKTGEFNSDTFSTENFDLITCIHTLEHIYEPINLLSLIKDRLIANGYIFIEVPNIKKPLESLEHFFEGSHLCVFSLATLTILLHQADLKILKIEDVPRGLRVLAGVGKNYTENKNEQPILKDNYKEITRLLSAYRMGYYAKIWWKDKIKNYILFLFREEKGRKIIKKLSKYV